MAGAATRATGRWRSRTSLLPHQSATQPRRRHSGATIECQQLTQGVVVGDVSRPPVGGRDGDIESCVCVHEPLRPGVVEVRQRALPERLRWSEAKPR